MKSLAGVALTACLGLFACTIGVDPSSQEVSDSEDLPPSEDGDGGEDVDVGDPEPLVPPADQPATPPDVTAGTFARVCNATSLNQRSGAGTSYDVVKVLPGGSTTKILAVSSGWYQNDWNGSIGWSSGTYLCPAADPGVTPTPGGDGFASTTPTRANFLSIGQASVGFSYWWGGGRLAAGASPGTCSGACPSCTHGGSYGVDCSSFVAKAWLLPAALPMSTNLHPYSTSSFAGSSSLWSTVSRASMQAGDALVYRTSTSGHIVMYEKDDPWGQFWSYEARGCSYGVVHNIRTAGSAYKGIRRAGV
ncbi:MAG: SH3 domain-containing protein [Deltaproteobacteria bacterium]|nr:SH3 domain-containing protein [Deltaproteobacteria bacterium]